MLFHKVIGKKCTNPVKPQCPEFGVLKDASDFLCAKCNRELDPVTKPKTAIILAAVAGVILVVGCLAYLTATHLGGLSLLGSGGGSTVPGKPDLGDRPASGGGISVQYALQADGEGRPQVVSSDYVFHSGDRFRLLLKGESKSSVLYVFYEDRAKGRFEVLYPDGGRAQLLESGEVASVPPGEGSWIRLDEAPGVERFVILAATHPLDDLPFNASYSNDEFDLALQQIRKKQGLTETKTKPGPDWVEAKGREGVLLTRLTVKHQ
jgi:hypothetical protein